MEIVELVAVQRRVAGQECLRRPQARLGRIQLDQPVEQGQGRGPGLRTARRALRLLQLEDLGLHFGGPARDRRIEFARPSRGGHGRSGPSQSQLRLSQPQLAGGVSEQAVARVAENLERLAPAAGAQQSVDHAAGSLGAQGARDIQRLRHADIGFRPPVRPGLAEGFGEALRLVAIQPRVGVAVLRRGFQQVAPEGQDEPVQMRLQRSGSGR